MILRNFITGITALCIAAALTGCSRSPRVSFYTLGSAERATTVSTAKGAPSVSVANITLPDLVNRPQLIERVNASRVEILETHRWAEPLKNGISRLLAETLANQLGSDRVTSYLQNSDNNPDYKVFLDIQRFEAMGTTVTVDAIWTIRRTPTGTSDSDKPDTCGTEVLLCQQSGGINLLLTKSGRSQVRESSAGDGYEALVAAYNRAMISVGNDIAQTIRTDWAGVR
jgi:uncharacterized lipoprotein YmbA